MSEQFRYLALLRGINVGGNNIIAKQDLIQCFKELGFNNIRTYIQSGNILFRDDETSIKNLTQHIENGLSNRFGYDAHVIVLSYENYQSIIQAAPPEWGKNDQQKHNALFMLHDIEPAQILSRLTPPIPDIETVTASKGVIFWTISKSSANKATYTKLPGKSVYKQLTIRNHNTVFKLLNLFEEI